MTDHLTSPSEAFAFSLDASRTAPLYQQLSEDLRSMIVKSNWPADSAIPSERELMRMTGLSRMTVRQAIDSLTREGLLQRIHGRGTYIVPVQVEQDINGVFSFSEQIRAQGRSVTTILLESTESGATFDELATLELSEEQTIFRVTRLRLIDGDPVCINYSRIPAHMFPGLLEHDLTGSLYGIWTNHYNCPPTHSIDTVAATGAARDIAPLLGVKTGTALSLVRRVARTHGGVPIELTEEFARPDRLRYRLQNWALPVADPIA